ncbi:MAG: hypothetical protein GY830_10190 [Bacteroidetes bacterium]|nr:hypothetical protein [Bacteroidota bacterium]
MACIYSNSPKTIRWFLDLYDLNLDITFDKPNINLLYYAIINNQDKILIDLLGQFDQKSYEEFNLYDKNIDFPNIKYDILQFLAVYNNFEAINYLVENCKYIINDYDDKLSPLQISIKNRNFNLFSVCKQTKL